MALRAKWQFMDRSVTHKIVYGPQFRFGPYYILWVTSRSINCHMTLSAMNYLLNIDSMSKTNYKKNQQIWFSWYGMFGWTSNNRSTIFFFTHKCSVIENNSSCDLLFVISMALWKQIKKKRGMNDWLLWSLFQCFDRGLICFFLLSIKVSIHRVVDPYTPL